MVYFIRKHKIFPFLCLIFFSVISIGYAKSGREIEKQEVSVQENKNQQKNNEVYVMGEKESSLTINLNVEKYQLSNGLQVLLHADERIPQVYHLLLVKVGSRDEIEGKTGLAHLFEHMMFRGTAKYTGEEYEEKLESIGAKNNAYTSRDHTGYEVLLPRDHLKMILEMEAERLNSLQLTQVNFDKEREVVKEERRQRTDNNPNEIFEPIMKTVFSTHSYGRPIIGWMKDLEEMDLKDCKEFYEQYYAPNNAVLILAGDFNIKKAKSWIEKYYGVLKPSRINRPAVQPEPEQKKIRSLALRRSVHAPTLAFAYKGPKVGDKNSYSLEVLSRVLTSGESSRLYKPLVYQHKLALSVGGMYYALADAGVFLVFVKMAPGASLEQVKKIIYEELKKSYTEDVEQKELLKSKRAIMHEYVSAVKDLSGKANSLGVNEAYFSDYRQFFRDLEQFRAVTAETVKKSAYQYLLPEKSSIVELLPVKQK